MKNEYLDITKDIFGGMLQPKKHIETIKRRDLSLKPLLVVIILLVGLTVISMLRIQNAAVSFSTAELPQFIKDNLQRYEMIMSSTVVQMIVQVVYSLVIALLMGAIYLRIITWLAKVDLGFKKCLVLLCYAWGPNILSAMLLTILVLVLPSQRTMFAQGLFDVLLGGSSPSLTYLNIFDPFYLWSVVVLGLFTSKIPNKYNRTSWHFWVYVVFLIPMISNLIYLMQ